jgi:hypothetical protein
MLPSPTRFLEADYNCQALRVALVAACRSEIQRNLHKEKIMPRYVIEREIPGAGKLSAQELKGIAQKSCGVLSKMGPSIQWLQSFVTGDKVYCVYIAPNEKMVRDHAQQGGFPANRVSAVTAVMDPITAE